MRLGVVSQSGMVPIISIMLLWDAHVHKPLGASLSRETRDRLAGNTKREKTQKTNRSRKEEKNRNEKNPPDASHLESRSIASRPHCPFGSMTRLAGRVCRRRTNLSIAVGSLNVFPSPLMPPGRAARQSRSSSCPIGPMSETRTGICSSGGLGI